MNKIDGRGTFNLKVGGVMKLGVGGHHNRYVWKRFTLKYNFLYDILTKFLVYSERWIAT